MKFFRRILVPLILAWVGVSGLFMAWNDTMTTDEGIHVSSAYLAITRQDFRFDPEHPFLFKYLTALPLFVLNLNMPSEDETLWDQAYPTTFDSWEQSRRWTELWFYQSENPARTMIFLARMPGVIAFTALCWLVWTLGTSWFSRRVGILALLFTAFNPTLLGHGHLTNTDVPVALVTLGVMWGMWNYFKRGTVASAALLGLLLGIAQTTKFSAIILIPAVIGWFLYRALVDREWLGELGRLLLVGIIVITCIWLVYLMPLQLMHGTAFEIKGDTTLPKILTNVAPYTQQLFERLLFLRYIFPVDYLKGLALVLGGAISGRDAYLVGMAHDVGFWYYFLLLYVMKTQVAGIILLAAGLTYAVKDFLRLKYRISALAVLFTLVAGLMVASSIDSKLNIGLRHIAPLLVMASFAMALGLDKLTRHFKTTRLLGPAFLVAYCALPLLQFPNFIGYSNIFVQPYSKAYAYFNDSNLDWGAQGRQAATVAKREFPGQTYYSNFNWSPYVLDYYEVKARSFNGYGVLEPGTYIITGTQMSQDEYGQFRDRNPDRTIGNTVYFFVVK